MIFNLTFILILAATVLTGLLAGISLDKAIVQLPARHRMGVIGFAAFSRANDLGAGLIAYPVLGISAALLTISAALAAFFDSLNSAQQQKVRDFMDGGRRGWLFAKRSISGRMAALYFRTACPAALGYDSPRSPKHVKPAPTHE